MGGEAKISPELKRFILTRIDSVPHLETVLLLRKDPKEEWDAKRLAQRLFVGEESAGRILDDLAERGLVVMRSHLYHYEPIYLESKEMVDQLAAAYAEYLREVTALIHSKLSKQAQDLGEAFRWGG